MCPALNSVLMQMFRKIGQLTNPTCLHWVSRLLPLRLRLRLGHARQEVCSRWSCVPKHKAVYWPTQAPAGNLF